MKNYNSAHPLFYSNAPMDPHMELLPWLFNVFPSENVPLWRHNVVCSLRLVKSISVNVNSVYIVFQNSYLDIKVRNKMIRHMGPLMSELRDLVGMAGRQTEAGRRSSGSWPAVLSHTSGTDEGWAPSRIYSQGLGSDSFLGTSWEAMRPDRQVSVTWH